MDTKKINVIFGTIILCTQLHAMDKEKQPLEQKSPIINTQFLLSLQTEAQTPNTPLSKWFSELVLFYSGPEPAQRGMLAMRDPDTHHDETKFLQPLFSGRKAHRIARVTETLAGFASVETESYFGLVFQEGHDADAARNTMHRLNTDHLREALGLEDREYGREELGVVTHERVQALLPDDARRKRYNEVALRSVIAEHVRRSTFGKKS